MDYLRRLYPGHADTPGAARLDLAPAIGPWPALADESMAVRPRADGGTALDTPAWPGPSPRRPGVPGSPSRPPDDAATSRAPAPAPLTSQPAAPDHGAPRELRSSSPLPSPPLQGQQTSARQPRSTEAFTAPQAITPLRTGAATARASQVEAQPLAPLRISTVLQAGAAERERTAAEPAPIVHVTIDRIDVRLPSAPAAAATPARRRPASAVGGLGDYLRGRSTESNP